MADEGTVWTTFEPGAESMRFQFMPTALVSGGDNIMAAAWLTQVSVVPPLFVVSIRKERHTYPLIAESGEFALNFLGVEHAARVDLCGKRSGRKGDKFKAAGLTRKKAERISTTLVEESFLIYEFRVVNEVEAGDHQLFIGEVLFVHRREPWDHDQVRPLIYAGDGKYTTAMRLFEIKG
ncbi:MAG: flavin reductase family protein [Thermoplasmata archaeon]|nr:flavin reductase family protein [Thermoplasmata archaeon]